MTTDTARFAASEARKAQDIRRAKVAPLLAAGLSVRAISAETGIPIGAVHRAKRQIEKMVAQQGGQKAAAISFEPPLSYLVKEDINGVQQDVRRLTVSVFERAADLPARCGSCLRPRSVAVSHDGCSSQLVSPVLSPARISVSSSLLQRATMSQKSSLPQPARSVS